MNIPPNTPTAARKKIYIAVTIVALIAAFAIADRLQKKQPPANEAAATAPAPDTAQLKAAIASLNAQLPKKLDQVSTLQTVSFADQTFVHHITINKEVINRSMFHDELQKQLKVACTDPSLSAMLRNDIKLDYVYSDVKTPDFTTITVTKADCDNMK